MHEKVQNSIKQFIEQIGGTVLFNQDDRDKIIWCAVTTPDARLFTMREGDALNALNHIMRRIVESKFTDEEIPQFIIDISNFKKKKIENLRAIAHMIAERARFFKSNIDVDPMSAFDRRIVHEFLSNLPDIKTESVGEGKTRHIVVSYITPSTDRLI